jgi:hypothetical protein
VNAARSLAVLLAATAVLPAGIPAADGSVGSSPVSTGWIAGDVASTHTGTLWTVAPGSLAVDPVGATGDHVTAIGRTVAGLYGISQPTGTQYLYRIDPSTAQTTQVEQLNPDGNEWFMAVAGLADGTALVSSETYTSPPYTDTGRLYRTDLTGGGGMTLVGSPNADEPLPMLAGACGSTLYGVDTTGTLVSVDPTTGAVTKIGALTGSGLTNLDNPEALAYDHAGRSLWVLTWGDGGPNKLFQVDPATGAVTQANLATSADSQLRALAFDPPSACRYTRSLSLHYSMTTNSFHGRLSSAEPTCVPAQSVRLLRRQPGPDAEVGRTQTNRYGHYLLASPQTSGTYYAVAPRSRSARATCLRAVAPALTL